MTPQNEPSSIVAVHLALTSFLIGPQARKNMQRFVASRSPMLTMANLANTHDPATDDPTITGKRKIAFVP
jgi:hypothetical protein